MTVRDRKNLILATDFRDNFGRTLEYSFLRPDATPGLPAILQTREQLGLLNRQLNNRQLNNWVKDAANLTGLSGLSIQKRLSRREIPTEQKRRNQ